MAPRPDLRAAGEQIERLLDEMQATADPRAYEQAEELLRLVTELYGAGLGRVVAVVGGQAPEAVDALERDELVASLLIVHGLHSESLEARVEGALAGVRPFLAQHGGDVELVDLDAGAGAVLLRLLGSCDGCPSSAVTLQQAVERAIVEAAPEIGIIDVEEAETPDTTVRVTLGLKPVHDQCPTEVPA